MKYQLVFQFEAFTLAEFDSLIGLETHIGESLAQGAVLDGHDFGMGEFNIFIHTNAPESFFELVAEMIQAARPDLPFAAGYRDFGRSEWQALWPEGLPRFSVQ